MAGLTIFEFDAVFSDDGADVASHRVPKPVFDWLEATCLKTAQDGVQSWLKLGQRKGRRCVQVTSFVGVIRAPNGYQIEVLPKVGKVDDAKRARTLLIDMLRCMYGFRHIQTDSAHLSATRMPLLEVFIREFLLAVQVVVKRGLRSDYVGMQDNLFAMRGKLLMSEHLRRNLTRADRFFTAHDQFIPDRPENRLIHTALHRAIQLTRSPENQRLGQELRFVFAELPTSKVPLLDFQQVRLDRGMSYYEHALDWAKLILTDQSPLTGIGDVQAPSLLFPMEALFEAYVEKHVRKQLGSGFKLKAQARNQHLVHHLGQKWFRLKPDLLVHDATRNHLVLDTKWKLLDASKGTAREKYQLSQADFYQLYAYGHQYLKGEGDVVLIYPATESFSEALPEFVFSGDSKIRLWVVPFCLRTKVLLTPMDSGMSDFFGSKSSSGFDLVPV
jgi:5-methylcytosine-specific restriction enzyme subunit McrC